MEFFQRLADKISYILTTWQNFVFWVVLTTLWVALGPVIAQHNFMPEWFTSTSFNFPLNTITTLAELFIGFLLGVNAVRIQKQQDEHQKQQTEYINHIKGELDELIQYVRKQNGN